MFLDHTQRRNTVGKTPGFCVYSRLKMDHKDSACRSYRPVHAFKTPNRVLLQYT